MYVTIAIMAPIIGCWASLVCSSRASTCCAGSATVGSRTEEGDGFGDRVRQIIQYTLLSIGVAASGLAVLCNFHHKIKSNQIKSSHKQDVVRGIQYVRQGTDTENERINEARNPSHCRKNLSLHGQQHPCRRKIALIPITRHTD